MKRPAPAGGCIRRPSGESIPSGAIAMGGRPARATRRIRRTESARAARSCGRGGIGGIRVKPYMRANRLSTHSVIGVIRREPMGSGNVQADVIGQWTSRPTDETSAIEIHQARNPGRE